MDTDSPHDADFEAEQPRSRRRAGERLRAARRDAHVAIRQYPDRPDCDVIVTLAGRRLVVGCPDYVGAVRWAHVECRTYGIEPVIAREGTPPRPLQAEARPRDALRPYEAAQNDDAVPVSRIYDAPLPLSAIRIDGGARIF